MRPPQADGAFKGTARTVPGSTRADVPVARLSGGTARAMKMTKTYDPRLGQHPAGDRLPPYVSPAANELPGLTGVAIRDIA
jgi:hypothetical protein